MNDSKYIVITGASSGIGEYLAYSFAKSSFNLILLARREDKLKEVRQKCEEINSNIKIEYFKCDVTKKDDLDQVASHFKKNNLKLHSFIANAGFGVQGKMKNITLEDCKRQFDTNIYGVLNSFYSFKDQLIEDKANFTIVGSVLSYISIPKIVPYNMSKHAVRALADGLYYEMLKEDVSITLICPGFIDTELRFLDNEGKYDKSKETSKEMPPLWIFMPADKASDQIKHAVLKRKKEVVITFHGKIALFFNRYFPFLNHLLFKLAFKK